MLLLLVGVPLSGGIPGQDIGDAARPRAPVPVPVDSLA